MPFNPGENVGPYRFLEQLGQGGMASVYKAYHPALDRFVAVKALHPALGNETGFVERFQREARLVARLDHPNIVPIFDFAQHEGRPYLVMRYIEGRTLKARLLEGHSSRAEIVAVAGAVGSALAFAHQQGMLHRDVKPSNVLLADSGQIYLADFGLARMAQAADSTLSSDVVMGTPQYISPEQARGEKNLTPASDIYSFGVVLYEMVVGQVPFNADTPFSIIHDHIYSPLPMPRSINPGVSEEVQRVLLKALAKDPGDRHRDVPSLVEAFKRASPSTGDSGSTAAASKLTATSEAPTFVQAGPTVSAPSGSKPSSPPLAGTAIRRRRWVMLGGGATVFCLLLACLIALAGNRNREQRELAATLTAGPPAAPTIAADELATTEAYARLNPNDAQALLQLSVAHWDASNPRVAMLELQKAARLAGPVNGASFESAGDAYLSRQAWLPAAFCYRLALKAASAGASAQLTDEYHESVYKAATMPGFLDMLPREKLQEVDEAMGSVAEARYRYYSGEEPLGKRILQDVLARAPHFKEAMLLDAEIKLAGGDVVGAREIAGTLAADSATPLWISELAGKISGKPQ